MQVIDHITNHSLSQSTWCHRITPLASIQKRKCGPHKKISFHMVFIPPLPCRSDTPPVSTILIYTHPSLCLLGWRPHTRCGLCGWACWWSGYVDATARSRGSCPRCCCTPKGWRRHPSQRWTSRSPSRHPPPLGTGAGKIDSWAPALLWGQKQLRRQGELNVCKSWHKSSLCSFKHCEKCCSACNLVFRY